MDASPKKKTVSSKKKAQEEEEESEESTAEGTSLPSRLPSIEITHLYDTKLIRPSSFSDLFSRRVHCREDPQGRALSRRKQGEL